MNVNDRLQDLSMNGVDVLILGAGINGAGLFRDLCEQGVRCLMVEKTDFGSGTSSAPSRLIHGGLKYLETGEFRLVAQSTLERNLLLRNAPHCVEPLATVIPIFSYTKGIWAAIRTLFGSTTAARSRGAFLLKIGLSIYDFYGSRANVMPRHHMAGKARALREMPELTPRIVAAGTYYDAKISRPERLVWELLADGMAAEPGSVAVNYTSLVARDGGALEFARGDGSRFSVRPKLVINAAGPWIDTVNASLGVETKLIGGTKGSHILLDYPKLLAALKGQMIYFETDDGRILLVYEYLGKAMVGSTDIKAANPDTVRCEDDEIDYFITALRGLLPGLTFDRTQITYAYSGIRPLPASDAATPGLISRDHSTPISEPVADRPFAIVSLVGGKWTTFRGFAEEVADLALKRLGRGRKVSTRALTIGGGKGYPVDAASRQTWVAQSDASAERAEQLLSRYGTTAQAVLAYRGVWSDTDRLPHAQGYSLAEIDYIARQESVERLADIVLRRTTLAITGAISAADLAVIADVAGTALGWTSERRAQEVAEVTEVLTSRHRMRL